MSRNKKYKNPSREIVDGKSKQTKCYKTWKHMMSRCYSSKYQEKYPTYIDCTVCEEWKDFDNFYEWFQTHYKEGFALDKDILNQGNKVYSPSTCCFVPQSINSLFIKRDAKRGDYPLGVNYHKPSNRYKAQCCDGKGKRMHLGYFTCPLEAHKAYCTYKYQLIEKTATLALECGDINWDIYDGMINYQIPMY